MGVRRHLCVLTRFWRSMLWLLSPPKAPGPAALSYLGAGPVENLLAVDDEEVRERLKDAISSCPALAEASRSSW